jgi:hypothetical protein
MNEAMTGTGALLLIIGLVLAVLWILLPLAVFGIKRRLDTVIGELSMINSSIRRNQQR